MRVGEALSLNIEDVDLFSKFRLRNCI